MTSSAASSPATRPAARAPRRRALGDARPRRRGRAVLGRDRPLGLPRPRARRRPPRSRAVDPELHLGLTPLFWVVVAQAGPTKARSGRNGASRPTEGHDERTTRNRHELDHRAGGRRRFRREGRGRGEAQAVGREAKAAATEVVETARAQARDVSGQLQEHARTVIGDATLELETQLDEPPAPLHRCHQAADRRAPRAGRGPRRRGRADRRLGPDCGRAGRAPRRPGQQLGPRAWPTRSPPSPRRRPLAFLAAPPRPGSWRPSGPQRRPEHRAPNSVVCSSTTSLPNPGPAPALPAETAVPIRVPAPFGDPLVVGRPRRCLASSGRRNPPRRIGPCPSSSRR